tara:strand:+ start:811 stop:1074 length:264 start_codon:yes stop_codon:yes gene_type:complete
MSLDIEKLKKKIIYRSNYRGSKEMDDILFSFVQENIENLNKDELIDLLDLINIDDENLNKFKLGLKTNIEIKENRITNLFKNFFYEK